MRSSKRRRVQDTGGTSGSTDEDSFDEIFKAGLDQAKLVMNNNVGEVVGGRDTWDSSESDETSNQGTGFKTQVRGDSCSETQSTEDEESSTEEEAELGELAELLEVELEAVTSPTSPDKPAETDEDSDTEDLLAELEELEAARIDIHPF